MTKFTVTREKPSKKEDKDYEIIREYKREREHVMKLEKELKAHEKTDITHAHPQHSPSQSAHPLPSMRRS